MLAQLCSNAEIAQRVFDKTYEAAIAENGRTAAIPPTAAWLWDRHGGRDAPAATRMAAGGPVALSADGRELAYRSAALSQRVPRVLPSWAMTARPRWTCRHYPRAPAPSSARPLRAMAKRLAAGTQNGFVQIWKLGDIPRPPTCSNTAWYRAAAPTRSSICMWSARHPTLGQPLRWRLAGGIFDRHAAGQPSGNDEPDCCLCGHPPDFADNQPTDRRGARLQCHPPARRGLPVPSARPDQRGMDGYRWRYAAGSPCAH